MPHGNIHAQFAVYKVQKAEHIVIIIKRFSDAHQHNMGNRQSGVNLGEHYLLQHFPGLQPADKAAQCGSAEGATHSTTHFCGDADCVAVMIAHQHRFHAVSVGKHPKIFNCAVFLGFLLANHFRGQEGILFIQSIPQTLGQVGHFPAGSDTLM